MGDEGADDLGNYKRSAMRMIHGVCNIQNYQEDEELKEIWKYIEELSCDNKY